MAMLTDSLLDAFESAHKLGQHAPMTIHEEAQLIHSHRRRRELERALHDACDYIAKCRAPDCDCRMCKARRVLSEGHNQGGGK